MARIQTFEDLIAWQKARALCQEIHQCTRGGRFAEDRDLRRQIRRAAVSVISNIAEGFERGRKSEFAHFLAIAKGSCGEVRAQLYVALDEEYLTHAQFEALNESAAETGRIIAGLRRSITG
jgi:four helix bundle protein